MSLDERSWSVRGIAFFGDGLFGQGDFEFWEWGRFTMFLIHVQRVDDRYGNARNYFTEPFAACFLFYFSFYEKITFNNG